jgi:hypothetical protein
MHQLDYELGFISEDEEEDFSEAGGAKALRHACGLKCNITHAFSKSKRLACKDKCDSKYEVRLDTGKTFGINKLMSAQEEEEMYAIEEAEAEAQLVKLETEAGERAAEVKEKKAGMGTGAKIGIAVGVLVLVVGIIVIVKKIKK